jgi:hypothetical protein
VVTEGATLRRISARPAAPAWERSLVLAIVVIAFSLRLLALFWITPVDFRWESYHFWQIAYYTLKVGLGQGRLWDLDGMEYFWGPLPILTQSMLLAAFNTTSMLLMRIANVILGAAMAGVAYFVARSYFNRSAGLLAGALIAVNPVLVFNSTVGMAETMGVFFLILALAVYSKHPLIAGVVLGAASLSRIELWLIAIGIMTAYLAFEKDFSKFLFSLIGWLVVMLPYFVHVRGTTGDPFYAFYWNFVGNIAGVWTPWYVDPVIRGLFAMVLITSILGLFVLLWVNWKRFRIKSYILYVLLLGYLAYHGLVYTLGGLAPLFERFFLVDLAVGSIIVAALLSRSRPLSLVGIGLVVLVATSGIVMTPYYVQLQQSILDLYAVADRIGAEYHDGIILSDMPMITYRLINKWGISYRNILGTLYIPYEDSQAALKWIRSTNATWLVVADPKGQRALNFLLDHATLAYDKIVKLAFDFNGGSVYQIDQNVVGKLLVTG